MRGSVFEDWFRAEWLHPQIQLAPSHRVDFKNAAEQSLLPSFLIGGKGTLQLYGRVASSQSNRNNQLVVRAHRHEQPWATAADPPVSVWETESVWAVWGRWTAKSLCKSSWVVPALTELMAWETWRLPVQCSSVKTWSRLSWGVWLGGTGLYSKLPAYNVTYLWCSWQHNCNAIAWFSPIEGSDYAHSEHKMYNLYTMH